MSAEIKSVEEKVKRDKDALPLEEMTLAEVGMDIPDELTKRGWLPTDRINARRSVQIEGERWHQFIICDALNLGLFEYVLVLIRTYKRKDKIGLDPNVTGMMKLINTFIPARPIIKIMYLYKYSPSATLDLLLGELIQAGAFLSYVAATDYYKLNLPKWGIDYLGPIEMPIDFFADDNAWKQFYEPMKTIPFRLDWPGSSCPKQLFVNMQFLTEDFISDRPDIKTKEAFKELVGHEIAYHTNLFNLICDYIPFDRKINLEETTEKFNDADPKCKQKFFETLKTFLFRHYEEYRMEQMKLQKAEKERWEKEEKESQEQAMAWMPYEVHSLRALVVKQAEKIEQQSEMMRQLLEMNRQQGKQMAELRMMFQRFLTSGSSGGSLGLDAQDGMASVLSLPASGSIKDQFEICEPKPHKY